MLRTVIFCYTILTPDSILQGENIRDGCIQLRCVFFCGNILKPKLILSEEEWNVKD